MATRMNRPRVLLVDDEPDIVRTLEFRLEAAGCDVVTAANGAEAVEELRGGRVDLVLADFMMPEMNGIEMTRIVKANPLLFDTKILLFSANPDPEFRRKAIEMGAADYLSKTLGAQAIIQKARELLGPAFASDAARKQTAESEVRASLKALARSLNEVLQLAQAADELPSPTQAAIDSAQRIVAEMQGVIADETSREPS